MVATGSNLVFRYRSTYVMFGKLFYSTLHPLHLIGIKGAWHMRPVVSVNARELHLCLNAT